MQKTAKSVRLLYNIERGQIENNGPISENNNSCLLMRSCTHLKADAKHAFNIQYIGMSKKPVKRSLEFGRLADAQSYSITFRASAI